MVKQVKNDNHFIVDCLQYANWSPKIFKEMRLGGVKCIHVTIAYHENFRETVLNLEKWNESANPINNLKQTNN